MTQVASADISRLADALRTTAKRSETTTQQVMVESANFLLTEMEIRVPVKTGQLRESLGVRVEANRVLIGPTAKYAPYVEFGTQPHVIKAKNAQALVFKVGGKTVFARQVNHPGTKARPFVRPAFEAWVESVGPAIAAANVEVLQQEAS
jgi:HK97 gp10 family phage protein